MASPPPPTPHSELTSSWKKRPSNCPAGPAGLFGKPRCTKVHFERPPGKARCAQSQVPRDTGAGLVLWSARALPPLSSFVHISSPASKPALRAPRRQCPRFAKIYLLDLPKRDLSVGNISPLPALAWYAPNKELRKSGRPDGKG